MINFPSTLWYYIIEIAPSLALGLLLSGVVHEFLPDSLVQRHLVRKGVMPVLYVTIIGIILPVCCFGTLPIALSLRRKGVPLGPVLAFMVATPATSIMAILITWRLLGPGFTLYLCMSVIAMGLIIGLIGNLLKYSEVKNTRPGECLMCSGHEHDGHFHHDKKVSHRIISVLSFGFIDIPKHIGTVLIIAVILSAAVASIPAVESIIKSYLTGWTGYLSALVFGIIMFMCDTGSVPLVHAFIRQGLGAGAGMVLLLVGPITSYGALLIIKKEFGMKTMLVYLFGVSVTALLMGICFGLL